jgi:hypothetical protein
MVYAEVVMSFKVTKFDTQGVTYIVDWPQTTEMIKHIKKTDLFQIMFRTVRSDHAGLAIKLNNNEYDIMWVNSDVWFTQKNYSEYVQDMYEIVGLAFKNEIEADRCLEVMNKELMWRILDGNYTV